MTARTCPTCNRHVDACDARRCDDPRRPPTETYRAIREQLRGRIEEDA